MLIEFGETKAWRNNGIPLCCQIVIIYYVFIQENRPVFCAFQKINQIEINLAEAKGAKKYEKIQSVSGDRRISQEKNQLPVSNPYFDEDFQSNFCRLKNASFTFQKNKKRRSQSVYNNTKSFKSNGRSLESNREPSLSTQCKAAADDSIFSRDKLKEKKACFLPQLVTQDKLLPDQTHHAQSFKLPNLLGSHEESIILARREDKVALNLDVLGTTQGLGKGPAFSEISFPDLSMPVGVQSLHASYSPLKQQETTVPPLDRSGDLDRAEYNKLLEKQNRRRYQFNICNEWNKKETDESNEFDGRLSDCFVHNGRLCGSSTNHCANSPQMVRSSLSSELSDNTEDYNSEMDYSGDDDESEGEESSASDPTLRDTSRKSYAADGIIEMTANNAKDVTKQHLNNSTAHSLKQNCVETFEKKNALGKIIPRLEKATVKTCSAGNDECCDPSKDIRARYNRLATKMVVAGIPIDDYEVIPGGKGLSWGSSNIRHMQGKAGLTIKTGDTLDRRNLESTNQGLSDQASLRSQNSQVVSVSRVTPESAHCNLKISNPVAFQSTKNLSTGPVSLIDGYGGDSPADFKTVDRSSVKFDPYLDEADNLATERSDPQVQTCLEEDKKNFNNYEKICAVGKRKPALLERSKKVTTKGEECAYDKILNKQENGTKNITKSCFETTIVSKNDIVPSVLQKSTMSVVSEKEKRDTYSKTGKTVRFQNDKNNHASKYEKKQMSSEENMKSKTCHTEDNNRQNDTCVGNVQRNFNGVRSVNTKTINERSNSSCAESKRLSKSALCEERHCCVDADGDHTCNSCESQIDTSLATVNCCTESRVTMFSIGTNNVSSDSGEEISSLKDENGRGSPGAFNDRNSYSDVTISVEGNVFSHSTKADSQSEICGDVIQRSIATCKELHNTTQSKEEGPLSETNNKTEFVNDCEPNVSFCEEKEIGQTQLFKCSKEVIIPHTTDIDLEEQKAPFSPENNEEMGRTRGAVLREEAVCRNNSKDFSEIPTAVVQNRVLEEEYRLFVKNAAVSILGDLPKGTVQTNVAEKSTQKNIGFASRDQNFMFNVQKNGSCETFQNTHNSASEEVIDHLSSQVKRSVQHVFQDSKASGDLKNGSLKQTNVTAERCLESSTAKSVRANEFDKGNDDPSDISVNDRDAVDKHYGHGERAGCNNTYSSCAHVDSDGSISSIIKAAVGSNGQRKVSKSCSSLTSNVCDDQAYVDDNVPCRNSDSTHTAPLNEDGKSSLQDEFGSLGVVTLNTCNEIQNEPTGKPQSNNIGQVCSDNNLVSSQALKDTPSTVSTNTVPSSLNAPNNTPCEDSFHPCQPSVTTTSHLIAPGASAALAPEDIDMNPSAIIGGLAQLRTPISDYLRPRYYSSGPLLVPSFIAAKPSRKPPKTKRLINESSEGKHDSLLGPKKDKYSKDFDAHISGSKVNLLAKPQKANSKKIYAFRPGFPMVINQRSAGLNNQPSRRINKGLKNKQNVIRPLQKSLPHPNKEDCGSVLSEKRLLSRQQISPRSRSGRKGASYEENKEISNKKVSNYKPEIKQNKINQN